MGEDNIRGTIDELLRQEAELLNAEVETPEYVFFATTPAGKVVCGQPPMWGKYVLLPPWEGFDDEEPELRSAYEPKRQVVILRPSFGHSW